MKSTSESLSHPETSNGRAAGGNCVVARRGGEQPEADLRSQTRVNPIRFATVASLHDALMRLVKERVADGKVLGLIEGFLKQGVLENGKEIEAGKGSPQGSPQGGLISPLLANIYLNPLDWIMEEQGFKSVRYADDIIVLGQSADEAAAALSRIGGWMDAAELQLHPDKTRLVDMSETGASFDFLGYRFKRSKRGRLMRLVRPKSKQKLREALKKHTGRCNAHSMECIIAKVCSVWSKPK